MPREAGSGNANGNAALRVSFSIDESLRRKIRIASAFADMTPSEWCSSVIDRAASKAVQATKAGRRAKAED